MSLALNIKCKECKGEDFYKIRTEISVEKVRIEDDGRNIRNEYIGFAGRADEGLVKVLGAALPEFPEEYVCANCGKVYSHDDLHPKEGQETPIS